MTLPEMGLAGAWAGVMNAPLRQVFERVKGVMQVKHPGALTQFAFGQDMDGWVDGWMGEHGIQHTSRAVCGDAA